MTTYIEYELEDGMTILIAAPDDVSSAPVTRGGRVERLAIRVASKKFDAALKAVIRQAQVLRANLSALQADEVEVTFGLTTTGEAGNFAIGKMGLEANYEVKLKWNNREAGRDTQK